VTVATQFSPKAKGSQTSEVVVAMLPVEVAEELIEEGEEVTVVDKEVPTLVEVVGGTELLEVVAEVVITFVVVGGTEVVDIRAVDVRVSEKFTDIVVRTAVILVAAELGTEPTSPTARIAPRPLPNG
jgi:hypothetical protein